MAGLKGCRAPALYTVTKTGNVSVFRRLGFHVGSEQADAYGVSADGGPLMEAYLERARLSGQTSLRTNGFRSRAN